MTARYRKEALLQKRFREMRNLRLRELRGHTNDTVDYLNLVNNLFFAIDECAVEFLSQRDLPIPFRMWFK